MSLKRRASSAVKWMAVSTALVQLLDLAQRGVLARLLDRTDFGLASMTLIVVAVGNALADFGLSNAIVHRQDASRDQLSSLYWLSLASGWALFGLILGISPLVADFYGEPQLRFLIPLAASSFLIGPFGQQFQTLLQKELRFGLIARIEMAASLVGITVAIVTAFQGFGVLAIISRNLARQAIITGSMVAIGWKNRWFPRFYFNWAELDGFVSFGVYQMAQGFVARLTTFIDQILIGRVLGTETLGLYSMARILVVEPMTKVTPVLTRVAFPLFAKRQNDFAKLREGFLIISRAIAFGAYPAFVGIAVVAPLLIPLLYGPGWEAAIPLVQWFAPYAMLKALGAPLAAVVLARGRADISFLWFVCVSVLSLGAFYVAAPFGILYVVYAALGIACVLLVARSLIVKWLIGVSIKQYAVRLVSPLVLSLVMGVVVFGLRWMTQGVTPSWAYLAALVAAGAAVYAALVWKFESHFIRGAFTFLRNRKAPPEPGATEAET